MNYEFSDDAERKRILSNLLGNLSEAQRQTLFLYHYEGFSISEIAKYSECSEKTVKVRLKKARNKLNQNLKRMKSKDSSLSDCQALPLMMNFLGREESSAEFGTEASKIMKSPERIPLSNQGGFHKTSDLVVFYIAVLISAAALLFAVVIIISYT